MSGAVFCPRCLKRKGKHVEMSDTGEQGALMKLSGTVPISKMKCLDPQCGFEAWRETYRLE